MAKIFDGKSRIVPTWLEASRYLEHSGRTGTNLVLEISDIYTLTDQDRALIIKINQMLEAKTNLTVQTVASTIFPLGLYKKSANREQLYSEYKRIMVRGKSKGTWGTYFGRLIERDTPEGVMCNPLELLIRRLNTNSHNDQYFTSCYEAGVSIPSSDLLKIADYFEGDLPIYNPSTDSKRWYGGPCLSHISFKTVKEDGISKLNMTAIYRSHHYCTRALGNLIGLGQLLSFVAKNSNQKVGKLTCISTHAELDIGAWSGVSNTHNILGTEI